METGIIWKDVFTIGMILFAVIDIVGSIPIIVDLRSKMGHIQSEKATIVAAIIMIAFLFVGDEILKLIGIDANSFAVAGSFVLFFLALPFSNLAIAVAANVRKSLVALASTRRSR